MQSLHREYELDDSRERLDFARVHGWLTTTYWSPGISRERVEKAAQGASLVLGAYRDGEQVGYLRVISDRTTFGYLCDVFVAEAHRGEGLARAMVRFVLDHPDYQGLRRWLLATLDAHGVYASLGFEPIANPERWMAHYPKNSSEVPCELTPAESGSGRIGVERDANRIENRYPPADGTPC